VTANLFKKVKTIQVSVRLKYKRIIIQPACPLNKKITHSMPLWKRTLWK